MPDCHRLRRHPAFVFAPLALAGSLLCVALPPCASWAQGGAARAAAASSAQAAGNKKAGTADTEYSIKTALVQAIGKEDGALFGGLLETLADGKTAFHTIAETTSTIKQEGFSIDITGRTEMHGNYGSAFASDAELTTKVAEQTQTKKTKFFCDGQTLWAFQPDANKYTEQTFTSAKPKLADEVMGASFDVVGLLATEAANGFKASDSSITTDATYKVSTALFRGVPCRILTIGGVSAKQDKTDANGKFLVFVGLDKRLRGLQLQLTDKSGADFLTLTEVVKVMETLTPAPTPHDARFHFSPPAGAKKVESFDDGDDK